MTITCNLYIDGQWHDAEDRRTFTRRHPAQDDVASVAAAASLADGKRCVEAAASGLLARCAPRAAAEIFPSSREKSVKIRSKSR